MPDASPKEWGDNNVLKDLIGLRVLLLRIARLELKEQLDRAMSLLVARGGQNVR